MWGQKAAGTWLTATFGEGSAQAWPIIYALRQSLPPPPAPLPPLLLLVCDPALFCCSALLPAADRSRGACARAADALKSAAAKRRVSLVMGVQSLAGCMVPTADRGGLCGAGQETAAACQPFQLPRIAATPK